MHTHMRACTPRGPCMNREQEKVSFQKTTIKEKIAAICLEKKRSGAERTAEKREWRGESYPPPPISPQVKQEKGGGVPDHTDNKRWRRITSVKWLLMLEARGASGFFGRPGMWCFGFWGRLSVSQCQRLLQNHFVSLNKTLQGKVTNFFFLSFMGTNLNMTEWPKKLKQADLAALVLSLLCLFCYIKKVETRTKNSPPFKSDPIL